MVASETYAEFLREQLAPLGRVTLRRMFGKTGVFCDGVMLGRQAYQEPYLLAELHGEFVDRDWTPPQRHEIVEKYAEYIERMMAEGQYAVGDRTLHQRRRAGGREGSRRTDRAAAGRDVAAPRKDPARLTAQSLQ